MAGKQGDENKKPRAGEQNPPSRADEIVELDAAALEGTGGHPAVSAKPAPAAPGRRSVPPPSPGKRVSVPPPPPGRDPSVTLPIGTQSPSKATGAGLPMKTPPLPPKTSATTLGIATPPIPPRVASRPAMPAIRPPGGKTSASIPPPPPPSSLPNTPATSAHAPPSAPTQAPSNAATPAANAPGAAPAPHAASRTAIAGTPNAIANRAPEPQRDEIPWHSLYERLSREADALANAQPTRAALLLSAMARAAVDIAGDSAAADRALTRAGALAPDARHVMHSRRWIAERRGKPADVLTLARTELAATGEPRERTALLFHIASLEEYTANQPDSAERALRDAVALDPQDVSAWEALGALHSRRKNWRDAVAAWEALAATVEDAGVRSALHTAAATLREVHLDDTPGAQAALKKALESDPTNPAALASLEPIFLRGRAWIEYARVIVAQGDQVGDAATARECYERAGDVLWECAADAASAAACYERAAAIAPREIAPLEKFAAVLEGSGRFVDLPRVYERILQVQRDPTLQAAVLLKLGTILETRLDRPDEALEAYRRALEASPTFSPAARALSNLLRNRGQWDDLAAHELLEADRIVNPQQRSARYVAIGEIHETAIQQLDPAIVLYERAIMLDPANTAAFDALDRIYRSNGRWDALIALHERLAQHARDPRRLRATQLQLAQLNHDRAGEPERAAQLLRATLGGEQDEFPTLLALSRALADAGKWAEHADVLESMVKLLRDDEEVLRTLHRIGAVAETRLNDARRALAIYGRALDRAPKHEPTLQALVRVHQSQGRWEDVIATERRLLALAASGDEAATSLYRIGRICEDRLGKTDDAIKAYEESLARIPGYPPALEALERSLRSSAKWQRLAELFEKQSDLAKDPASRVRLLCIAAAVYELHLGDTGRAASTYERALVIAPDLELALWGLARLRELRAEWTALEPVLRTLLDKTTHSAARVRLLVRLARLSELRLAAPSKAAALYDEALATGGAASLLAIDRLRVARLEGKRDAAAHWLGHIATTTRDPRLALGYLRLRAVMIEFGGGVDAEAGDAWQSALAIQPADPAALEGLARTLARGVPDARLAQALHGRAIAAADVGMRTLLLFVAAALCEHAGRGSEGEKLYLEALEATPDFIPALAGLRRLHETAGNVASVAKLALRAAQASVDPANIADALLEAADLYVDRLSEPREGLATYRRLLAQQPANARAFHRALQLLEAAGDWKTASTLMTAHADALTDPTAQARLLAAHASILAEKLGDSRGAIDVLTKALAIRADEPALLGMVARLHEREHHWQDAARMYDRLAAAVTEGPLRREALLAQARIWTQHVRDYDRARTLLQEVQRIDPNDRSATTKLAEVNVLLGDHARARDLYSALSGSGPAPERARALVALADVNRTGLNDLPASHAAASAAFAVALGDPTIVALIEEHYQRTDDWGAFATIGDEALLHSPTPTPGVLALRMALARAYRDQLRAVEPADQHLRAAIEAFPNSTEARIAYAYGLLGGNDHAAVIELRRALELDPTCAPAYRGLMTVCQRAGMTGAAALMASVVMLLGEGGPQVEGALSLAVLPPPIPQSLSAEDALQQIVGATHARSLRRLIVALDPHLHEVFPAGQQAIASLTRVPENYPGVAAARGVAAALGVTALAMYRGNARDAPLLMSEPRALVVGAELLTEPGLPRLLFDCAAACARISAGATVGQVLPPDQVQMLVEVAVDPNADGPGHRELRKRLGSALPRRVRKEVERIVEEGGGTIRREWAAWDDEERKRALRVGVLFSRDLRAVAQAIAPEAVALSNADERRRALAKNAGAVDALRFAASETCWALHRRVFGQA